MKRGEIWWADLGPAAGRRPVLLLSRDEAYFLRELIMVAPVTSRIRRIPSEVRLGPEDGLPKPCVVNLDVIATIAKKSLQHRLATLTQAKSEAVDAALRFALGLQ